VERCATVVDRYEPERRNNLEQPPVVQQTRAPRVDVPEISICAPLPFSSGECHI
jgi:hypothetical protein